MRPGCCTVCWSRYSQPLRLRSPHNAQNFTSHNCDAIHRVFSTPTDGISSNDIVQEIEETFIEFNNNDQHKCKNITIFNDDICESNISLALSISTSQYSIPEFHGEAFSIELSVKSGENIVIGHNVAHVWIEEGAEPECSKSTLLIVPKGHTQYHNYNYYWVCMTL